MPVKLWEGVEGAGGGGGRGASVEGVSLGLVHVRLPFVTLRMFCLIVFTWRCSVVVDSIEIERERERERES